MKLFLILIIVSLISSITAINDTTTTTITTKNIELNLIKHDGDSELSYKNSASDIRVPQLSNLEKLQASGRSNVADETIANCSTNEDEETIISPGYPKENYTTSITVDIDTGIDLTIRCLDINPIKDYLKITLKPLEDNETNPNVEYNEKNIIIKSTQPIILTGLLKEIFKLRTLSSKQKYEIKIEFVTLNHQPDENSLNYKGFVITYKLNNIKVSPPTMPPDVTIPFDKLDTINNLLIVNQVKQNNETWYEMKTLLCNATNQYLELKKNQYYEPCYPNNITLTKVLHCPQNWPDTINCIELYFAIQLYDRTDSMTTIDPFSINEKSSNESIKPITTTDPFVYQRSPKEPTGLNETELNEMWNKFGRNIFKNAGYLEYIKANPNEQILLWISIGVGIILISFIIAVVIYNFVKTGYIKNKWHSLDEEEKKEYKNNDIDITMYPSPDQVVPELFPGHPNVYDNEIGYNINNGRIPSISERKQSREFESSHMIEEGTNLGYVEDEDERVGSSFRMRVNGVNRDEINT